MGKIIDLIIKNFEPILSELWNSIIFWRAITLLLVLFLMVSWMFRQKILSWLQKPQRIEHDRRIFTQTETLLTEHQLMEFLEQLGRDHSYYQNARGRLSRFCWFFEEVGNQYINKGLHRLTQQLVGDLNNLFDFLATNFFVYPDGQTGENTRLCMYPGLSPDREGSYGPVNVTRYTQYADQLDKFIQSSGQSYSKYRKAIKNILNI